MGLNPIHSSCGFFISNVDAPLQKFLPDGFVAGEEFSYLNQYAIENLIGLMSRESLNLFDKRSLKRMRLKSHERALLINEMFFIAQQLGIDDKAIIFKATSLMDRFLIKSNVCPNTFIDAKLTAFTCLLITSKNFEKDPMSLECVKTYLMDNIFTH